MGRMDRTANTIVLTTVKITPVMLCLVSVYLVVEKVGWANTVNKVNLLCLSYKKMSILKTA
jgi:ABC-type maltose transport system permease subunit